MRNTVSYLSLVLLMLILSNTIYSQENIKLRTDRDLYIAGEPFWIHVDCNLNGSDSASTLSKVVYLEILNAVHTPVLQKTLQLKDGIASTKLFIPDSIKTGSYLLRGYTQWMRNYNPNLFAHKVLSVLNPFKSGKFPKSETSFNKDTILFYPEGGKLLYGCNNQLVLQVLDKYGNARKTKGTILSDEDDNISIFKTNDAGYAKVKLNPSIGASYTINYTQDSLDVFQELPVCKKEGVLLQLNELVNDFAFSVMNMNNGSLNDFEGYMDIVSSLGDSITSYKIKKTESVVIDKKQLPNGVLCAYLYNAHDKLLATRYFMARDFENDEPVEIELEKTVYSIRTNVNVALKNSNNLKNVSVAVMQSELVEESKMVNNPFGLNSSSKNALLNRIGGDINLNDILQCYQAVNEVRGSEEKTYFLPEIEGKLFTGTMRSAESHQAIPNETLLFNVVGETSSIDISTTDSNGKFSFLVNQYGEKEIVIQPLKVEDSLSLAYNIDVDESFSNDYPDITLPDFVIPKLKADAINQTFVNMQINGLYKRSHEDYIDNTVYDSISFYGAPRYDIPIAKYIDLASVKEIIKEIVPTVFLQKRKGDYKFNIVEPVGLNKSEGDAYILVDGVFIRDIESVLNIPSEDLRKVELINLNYFYKGFELGRILAFYTKEANLSAMEFDGRLFRKSQFFYEPSLKHKTITYNQSSDLNKHLADYRNLLFWDTDIQRNQFEFYTSDNKGKYTIVVEGLNKQGVIERYQSSFVVE